MCLLEKLFFSIPIFRKKLRKYQSRVRVKVIQVFRSVSIEKKILIQEFLDHYGSVGSNPDQNKMKLEFIEMVKDWKVKNLIYDKYQILRNGFSFSTDELTTQNISEGFLISDF